MKGAKANENLSLKQELLQAAPSVVLERISVFPQHPIKIE